MADNSPRADLDMVGNLGKTTGNLQQQTIHFVLGYPSKSNLKSDST